MTAADVRDRRARAQSRLDALERGNPCVHEVGAVTGPEESLGPDEEVVVMLVPPDPVAVMKGFGQFLVRFRRGRHDLEPAHDEGGAVLVGEQQGLFGPEAITAVAGVRHVARRAQRIEPLPDVALVRARPRGQLVGGDRPAVGHGPEETQSIAHHDQRRDEHRAKIADRLLHEFVDLGTVDVDGFAHGSCPFVVESRSCGHAVTVANATCRLLAARTANSLQPGSIIVNP